MGSGIKRTNGSDREAGESPPGAPLPLGRGGWVTGPRLKGSPGAAEGFQRQMSEARLMKVHGDISRRVCSWKGEISLVTAPRWGPAVWKLLPNRLALSIPRRVAQAVAAWTSRQVALRWRQAAPGRSAP